MLYSEEVLDRRTGELTTISKGDWITVTELADLYGVGPRKARSVLRKMEFLGIEGSRDHARHRIQSWAAAQGLGRRIKGKAGARVPFDVISPEGRTWIEARWSQALQAVEEAASGSRIENARGALAEFQATCRLRPMTVHEGVSWLTHHFPDLTHSEVGIVLEVSQQLVSRYVSERVRERQRKEVSKSKVVLNLGKLQVRGLSTDQTDEAYG